MKVAVFSAKKYDREFLTKANKKFDFDMVFYEGHLDVESARLAFGFKAVCVFVNDSLNAEVLKLLAHNGVQLIALRCAGFNNVDLEEAKRLKLTVARVPAYSPHGVAEHTFALILGLNRRLYRAYNRVHDGNFSLEGLLGFELNGLTIGIIGTGKIGTLVCRIARGFGMRVLAYDPFQNQELIDQGVEYVPLDELYPQCEVISLHVPLMPQTRHLINAKSVAKMKKGVMLINTSRGALIHTVAVIEGLKSAKIGYLGLDVYEEEADLFFEDLSGNVIQDDVFARLLTFPNVIVTGHQAFFTHNALSNIASTTIKNISDFSHHQILPENLVTVDLVKK